MVDLTELDLGKRSLRLLREVGGIHDVETLLRRNERQLCALPGFGPGCLAEVNRALEQAGLSLTEDPFGAYTCARHGECAWDTGLANLFLCDNCAHEWQAVPFDGQPPEWTSEPFGGFCVNCNINCPDVALRQWFLCGTCERVARSIGRSVVAERFIKEQWDALVMPHVADLTLETTDSPTLRRRGKDDSKNKRAEIDFVARIGGEKRPAFGFELKTGKSYISGLAPVGAAMRQFQLDTSDCDDIVTVMEREAIPVYLLHVQVIDRAHAPTVEYKAIDGWWTDPFRMSEHLERVQRRPRETRDAAYFKTAMFEPLGTLADHIAASGPAKLTERIEAEGIPVLYRRENAG